MFLILSIYRLLTCTQIISRKQIVGTAMLSEYTDRHNAYKIQGIYSTLNEEVLQSGLVSIREWKIHLHKAKQYMRSDKVRNMIYTTWPDSIRGSNLKSKSKRNRNISFRNISMKNFIETIETVKCDARKLNSLYFLTLQDHVCFILRCTSKLFGCGAVSNSVKTSAL